MEAVISSNCVFCRQKVEGESRVSHGDHFLHKKCFQVARGALETAGKVFCPKCHDPIDIDLEPEEVEADLNPQPEGDRDFRLQQYQANKFNPEIYEDMEHAPLSPEEDQIQFIRFILPNRCQCCSGQTLLRGARVFTIGWGLSNISMYILSALMFSNKIPGTARDAITPAVFLFCALLQTALSVCLVYSFCRRNRPI